MRSSYAAVWRSRYEAQRDAYQRVLAGDLWPDWEWNERPEVETHSELVQGLRVLHGGDEATAQRFFARAVEIAERTEREKPYGPSEKLAYPRNRAAHFRAKAHARNLLGEGTAELTRSELTQAARDYAGWCRDYPGSGWDAQAQAYYLNAVRLALIAGNEELTAELLATRKGFKWHAEEWRLLKLLAVGDRSEATRDALTTLFDQVRNPDYRSPVFLETEVVILELALLLELHFGSGTPLDWPRAAARVGE